MVDEIQTWNKTELEQHILNLCVKAIEDQDVKERKSIGVTDISGPCMRKTWYDIQGIPYSFDHKTLCNFKMGNMVHDAVTLNKKQNEVAIKCNIRKNLLHDSDYTIPKKEFFDCISGRIDDLVQFQGKTIIVDKKTYSSKFKIAEKKKIDEDYIFQLNVYKLLFWIKTGEEVEKAVISYIDVATRMNEIRVFETTLWSIDEIKAQVIEKLNLLAGKTAPPRVIRKRCETCPFFKICDPGSDPNYSQLSQVW